MQKVDQIKPLVFKRLTFYKKRQPKGYCRIQTKVGQFYEMVF
jgi:hypothetical protein